MAQFLHFTLKPYFMKEKTGSPASDRKRVAAGEKWEMDYMSDKYGVSKKEVESAVQEVGNTRSKIEAYLKEKTKRK